VITPVTVILARGVLYLHEGSMASQLGKPWLKIPLSALASQLRPLGDGIIRFRAWIDRQHHLRKRHRLA